MKAVVIHEYGGPEVLKYEDVAEPQINPDDVLIKVYATSINPIDWKMRAGHLEKVNHRNLPSILGWDVSGVITKIGERVTNFKVNDEVYARPDVSREGTYAEYVAVKASEIAIKPKSITHVQTATIPLAGLTAWQGLFDHGKLEVGQRILIHGAAGGVGSLAVQLAKWKGAYVIGTTSEKNRAFLQELGVDEVIDYTKEKFEEKLKDLDVVFDTLAGDVQKKSIGVLKPGGILVSTLGIVDPEAVKAAGIKGEHFMAQSLPEQLQHMAQLIDEGKLKPIVSDVFPLQQVADAHRKNEEGHTRGKIAIQVVGV